MQRDSPYELSSLQASLDVQSMVVTDPVETDPFAFVPHSPFGIVSTNFAVAEYHGA